MVDSNGNGGVVIVGAGQAGLTTALALRENGWTGRIDLIESEPTAPYQRPPLSKGFLMGTDTTEDLITRPLWLLKRDRIRYRRDCSVIRIDRRRHEVLTDRGDVLGYDHLVLATGAAPRHPRIEGADLDGVLTLRTVAQAQNLRNELARATNVVVLGGGFLGLELATAAAIASRVTVLERGRDVLRRSVSGPMARVLATRHAERGVRILFGAEAIRLIGQGDRVTGVELLGGEVISADLVLATLGAVPNTSLAAAAGLDTADGIVVDARLQTSDPVVFAIGDCAVQRDPQQGRLARVESVQNAVDQGRFVAARITAASERPYSSTPWFWSHQAGQNLQIAGAAIPGSEAVVTETSDLRTTILRVLDGMLVAVETLNDPRTHVRARRALATGPVPVGEFALSRV